MDVLNDIFNIIMDRKRKVIKIPFSINKDVPN